MFSQNFNKYITCLVLLFFIQACEQKVAFNGQAYENIRIEGVEQSFVSNKLQDFSKQQGLTYHRWNMKDAPVSNAYGVQLKGENFEVLVQDLLGHKSYTITLYHVKPDASEESKNNFSEAFKKHFHEFKFDR